MACKIVMLDIFGRLMTIHPPNFKQKNVKQRNAESDQPLTELEAGESGVRPATGRGSARATGGLAVPLEVF